MSDLPACRLCGSEALNLREQYASCPSSKCRCFMFVITREQWIKLMSPATADESCDGCLNLKGEKKCFNCVRSAYVMDNYEAAKAGENVT